MALFPKNPLSALTGGLRKVFDIAGKLREPIGATIAAIGRALERQGASMEAAVIRDRVERERAAQAAAHGAVVTATRGMIAEADMPEATTKLRRRYSYQLTIESIDPLTGKRVERHITISSDRLRGDEELRGQAIDLFGESYGIDTSRVTRIEITGARKAGEAGTL